MEFAHACKGLGVKAITGAEVTLDDGSHLTLLAADRTGYSNLCRLLTLATRTRAPTRASALRRTPRSSRSRPRRGTRLPVGLRARRRGRRSAATWAERSWPRLLGAFGRERFRVELQRPFWRRDRARNRALAQLAERLGVPCVATGNVHSHHPDRARLQDAFVAVRLLSPLDQTEPAAARQRDSVMVSPAEMAERFRDHPGAVAETERIAERIEFDLTRDLGYRYPGAEDPDADRKLAELCGARLDERYPHNARARRGRARGWTRSCA